MPGNFLDTNILVYAVTNDPAKKPRANEILSYGGVVSVQVLNELTNVLRRKLQVSWPDVESTLAMVRDLLQVEPITTKTHEAGIALAKRYNFSIYDSMIVASALAAGCDRLWSEDMHDGMLVQSKLRIANPFGPRGT